MMKTKGWITPACDMGISFDLAELNPETIHFCRVEYPNSAQKKAQQLLSF